MFAYTLYTCLCKWNRNLQGIRNYARCTPVSRKILTRSIISTCITIHVVSPSRHGVRSLAADLCHCKLQNYSISRHPFTSPFPATSNLFKLSREAGTRSIQKWFSTFSHRSLLRHRLLIAFQGYSDYEQQFQPFDHCLGAFTAIARLLTL